MGRHRGRRVKAAESPQKTALVLSGGGVDAVYEVGVMQALSMGACPSTDFTPIDADIVTGTSAGLI